MWTVDLLNLNTSPYQPKKETDKPFPRLMKKGKTYIVNEETINEGCMGFLWRPLLNFSEESEKKT